MQFLQLPDLRLGRLARPAREGFPGALAALPLRADRVRSLLIIEVRVVSLFVGIEIGVVEFEVLEVELVWVSVLPLGHEGQV